ncbi:hypothetical protein CLV97_12473 [Planifilum fimeticola]|uniref:Uncharacterized protein n=1 Tax=Planifilum fimeticola TaxID=201975 RepID=A0A2T0LC27_9BACL|nr:hypothetical protein [Planifilum fimeticola]PRX39535.1 hypothetical protein CLV97_12473 [Planifilum fimeticola]
MVEKGKERATVSVNFNLTDPAIKELWDWMEERTTNKQGFILRVLFLYKEMQSQKVEVINNINIGTVPVASTPESEPEKDDDEEIRNIVANSGLPMDDDD